jgi:hypothetical protein
MGFSPFPKIFQIGVDLWLDVERSDRQQDG